MSLETFFKVQVGLAVAALGGSLYLWRVWSVVQEGGPGVPCPSDPGNPVQPAVVVVLTGDDDDDADDDDDPFNPLTASVVRPPGKAGDNVTQA